MHTAPFVRQHQPVAGVLSLAAAPERYPFHDNDECPVGQEVKRSEEWQYYEPTTIDETRPRCTICLGLNMK